MSPRGRPKMVECPDCSGHGQIPWAETMLKCAACDGTGKVKASGVSK